MASILYPGTSVTLITSAGTKAAGLSPQLQTVVDGLVTFTASLSGAFQTLVFALQVTDGLTWQTVGTWDAVASATFLSYLPKNTLFQLICTSFASSGGFNCSVSVLEAAASVSPNVTVSSPAVATSALQTTGNTSLASIDAKNPALVSGRIPVDGSGVTQPVSGTFFQATQPVSVAASVGITPPAITKGTQGATGLTTQDLKDAGRTYVTFTALAAAGVTAEALLSFSQNKQGAVTAAVTSYVIPSGKTLRITAITLSVRAGAAAVPFSRCILRHNTAGATIATSPVAFLCPEVFGISATAGVGGQIAVAIPDGLEFRGDGTQTIGMSHLDQATTNILNVTICGFEY